MNAIKALEELKHYPVFGIRNVQNVIDKSPEYARLFVHRLKARGLVRAVEKNKYTLHDEPLIIATYLAWPSYVSCQTALRYHNLTEQALHDVTVVTTKQKKAVRFNNSTIRFIKTKPKNIFGFEKKQHNGISVPIADAEKALLDTALHKQLSFSEVQSIVEEHASSLDMKKMAAYLLRIGNACLARRVGFLLDKFGYDNHKRLKRLVGHNYTKLDYAMPAVGRKDVKWRLLVNTG